MKKKRKAILLGATLTLAMGLAACNDEKEGVVKEPIVFEKNEEIEKDVEKTETEQQEEAVKDENIDNKEKETTETEQNTTSKEVAKDELGLLIKESAVNNIAYYLSADGLNNVKLKVTLEDNYFSTMNETLVLGYYRDYSQGEKLTHFEYTMGGLSTSYKDGVYTDTVEGKENKNLTNEEVELLFKEKVEGNIKFVEEDGLRYKKILENNPYEVYYNKDNEKYDTEVNFKATEINPDFPSEYKATMNVIHGLTGDGAVVESIKIKVKDQGGKEVYSKTYNLTEKYAEIHMN